MKGMVYLVGAGPGDPGLITVRGHDLLQRSDAVVFDRLVHPSLLEEVPAAAEMHYVGKSAGHHSLPQDEINSLLVRLAGEGKLVVRLKGGDPFVFGRGGEEALALRAAGFDFEIVPGVTSGIAAAAYAGIPVTHRSVATQCVFVTAHETPDKLSSQIDWRGLAALDNTTLVGYMGVSTFPRVVEKLLDGGKDRATPAALIESGTTSSQRTVTATLEEIVDKGATAGISPPALFVVGQTVSLADDLAWFGRGRLFGKRFVVTRARDQASALCQPLLTLGADVIHLPVIRTEPLDAGEALRRVLGGASEWDWILFTSENGVRYFIDCLRQERLDARTLGGTRIAAVGSGTATRLRLCGLEPDFVPDSFTTASLADGLQERFGLGGKRVLRVGPELDPDPLVDKLVEQGAETGELRVYRIAEGTPIPEVVADLREKGAHGCLFTSGSTVRGFFSVLGKEAAREILGRSVSFAIGPVTAQALRNEGVTEPVVAGEHSIPGLLRALRERFESKASPDII